MNNKKTLLLVGVLAMVLLIAGASVLYNRLSEEERPNQLATQGNKVQANSEQSDNAETNGTESEEENKVLAPDFTVYDIDGNEVHLSDYLGKPVILNFWASWCGPCKSEMPAFNAASTELEGNIQFLMINMTDGYQETIESASKFIAEQGYTFPVFYDTDSMAAMVYGATSLPTTYFIDAQGYAVAKAVGAINAATLQTGIDMILP